MRHLILTLAILAIGCGPQQTARGDDKPAVASLERVDTSVMVQLETIRTNTEATNATLEEMNSKLDALLAPSIAIPQKPVPEPPADPQPKTVIGSHEPTRADAPPASASDRRILFHGKPIDLSGWLAMPLTDEQTYGVDDKYDRPAVRAEVEKHLRSHGLAGDFSRLSYGQLIQIHSVAHLKDNLKPVKSKPAKVAAATAPVVQPYVQYQSGGCPNGQCNRPVTTYYYPRRR